MQCFKALNCTAGICARSMLESALLPTQKAGKSLLEEKVQFPWGKKCPLGTKILATLEPKRFHLLMKILFLNVQKNNGKRETKRKHFSPIKKVS